MASNSVRKSIEWFRSIALPLVAAGAVVSASYWHLYFRISALEKEMRHVMEDSRRIRARDLGGFSDPDIHGAIDRQIDLKAIRLDARDQLRWRRFFSRNPSLTTIDLDE